MSKITGQYPVLPLRTEVHLPGVVAPLEIGREASIRALEAASRDDNQIVVVPQKSPGVREPTQRDLLEVGVLAEIVQVVKHSPGRFTAVMRMVRRVHLDAIVAVDPFLVAAVSPVEPTHVEDTATLAARVELARGYLTALLDAPSGENKDKAEGKEGKGEAKPEVKKIDVASLTTADAITDAAAPLLELERDDLVELLIEADPTVRLASVLPALERKATVLRMKADINAQLEGETSRTHREKVLRDRMREIQEELGEADDNAELDELRRRVDASRMPDEPRAAARKQLSRMSQMPSASPEYNIARTYVETLLDLPWGILTDDAPDVAAARAILEAEHAGLDKVKKRILEYIAVRKLAPNKHGPILLLVGPPGVGKTSLGRSIASALGRKYVRMSLGGVRDEAEIRGHRRTYIGALPGRIASGMKKAGSMNPVFVLDEIDKLAADMRGDPAAAMLEVLDPEQNKDFVDHYVEVPLDLSKVMFICTANQLDTISTPLLDRMEVIEIPGYTTMEKLMIAKRHLVPKQLAEHGIEKNRVTISDEALSEVIYGYTRESGVRNLEREIAALCRASAVKVAGGEAEHVDIVGGNQLVDLLGPPRFQSDAAERRPQVGVATGLAWTPVGGDIMFIEARLMPGKGELRLTGQMGDVMRESAQAALSWVRANAQSLGVDHDRLMASDLHIHLPQGAVKKDGPSAGVALTIAVVSALTGRPVRNDVAITGEVDLRGNSLPVGGIKEKVLAAHRAGYSIVVLPQRNAKDVIEIPDEVRNELDIRYVTKAKQAVEIALSDVPTRSEPIPPLPPPAAPAGRMPVGNQPN